jgi:hypothetical protein
MKNKFLKFDYIFLLILILGSVFLVQQWLFSKTITAGGQNLFVKVKAPVSENLSSEELSKIKVLYLSNIQETSEVSIMKSGGEATFTFLGKGEKTGTKFIFNNEHFSLNQRVKLHGLLEAEGSVVEIGER